jgi:hypothetical protein
MYSTDLRKNERISPITPAASKRLRTVIVAYGSHALDGSIRNDLQGLLVVYEGFEKHVVRPALQASAVLFEFGGKETGIGVCWPLLELYNSERK